MHTDTRHRSPPFRQSLPRATLRSSLHRGHLLQYRAAGGCCRETDRGFRCLRNPDSIDQQAMVANLSEENRADRIQYALERIAFGKIAPLCPLAGRRLEEIVECRGRQARIKACQQIHHGKAVRHQRDAVRLPQRLILDENWIEGPEQLPRPCNNLRIAVDRMPEQVRNSG